jgi:uncharacterized protein (TIGR02678 family)
MSTAALADVIDQQRAEERRRALRTLLRHPLLTAAGPDPTAFVLVRRHSGWLRDWLAREAGWSLHVDATHARLRKVPGDLRDGTRAAVAEPAHAAFSRRRYVLLCLALAALERADAQVTLGWLADRVVALAGDPDLQEAGFAFALDSREDRKDLVVVARLLLGIRVLARVAGDEQAYVASSGDALYDVDRRVLSSLLVARRGPSMVAGDDVELRLRAITDELVAEADDARNRAIRHRLARRLLDDPVVYLEDLDEAEREYLSSQRHFLLRRLTEATGLVAESRGEGLALVDPTGEATDLRMPEEGTDGHATLLLAEHLARRSRERPGRPAPAGELEALIGRLATEHRSFWRKNATEPGAEPALTRLAIDRLEALGLVRRTPAGVVARPALARFAYARPVVRGERT